MSDVFVSYKREDEERVHRLVRALAQAGLPVSWDRSLAGGENWRSQIQSALDAAKCVIVVWTEGSVGPAGDFVRDEAGRAKQRGILVPVLMDRVAPPLGFGEIQAVDLTAWKGSQRDPFFTDLCAAVIAQLAGLAAPPATGPSKRWLRRVTFSSVTSAIVGCGFALGFNLFGAQERVCGLPLLQPQLSDACGGLGLGHRPPANERIAWQSREPNSCAALRAHIERFADGAYRDEAASKLAVRRVTEVEAWAPAVRRLALYVGRDDVGEVNEAAAQAAAIVRAQFAADRLCLGFMATMSFRFRSATPAPQVWKCGPIGDRVTCGFEGEAVCALEERQVQEHETCG